MLNLGENKVIVVIDCNCEVTIKLNKLCVCRRVGGLNVAVAEVVT